MVDESGTAFHLPGGVGVANADPAVEVAGGTARCRDEAGEAASGAAVHDLRTEWTEH